ncbi:hypothetical protein HYW32_00100 [Candidatus Berkelbacteria bacterium]|nr:hypothetical protein [Candidatus Berkelbacteria bacterium]
MKKIYLNKKIKLRLFALGLTGLISASAFAYSKISFTASADPVQSPAWVDGGMISEGGDAQDKIDAEFNGGLTNTSLGRNELRPLSRPDDVDPAPGLDEIRQQGGLLAQNGSSSGGSPNKAASGGANSNGGSNGGGTSGTGGNAILQIGAPDLGSSFQSVMYLTNAGNDEQTKKAKQLLIDAVIGMVIIVIAWAVGNYVLGLLGIGLISL